MDAFLSVLQNPTAVTVGVLVLEAVFHFVPSEKPLGVLHGASAVLKGVADFLDKILPQNLK